MATQAIAARMATRQKIRLMILFFMVLLFPITMNYFSVFLIIEGSSQGIMTFSFFFWTAWTALSLVFGRAACGYLCPLGAYQEMKDRAVPKPLKEVRYLNIIKYVLAVAWVGGIIAAAVSAGGYKKVELLYNTASGVSIDRAEGWIFWGIIVLLILLPVFFMGKRAFCRYFCPWGVLNTVGTRIKNLFRWPSLHLEGNQAKCKQCRTCLANCPAGLSATAMIQAGRMNHDDCILCGTCVDNCPNKAIVYSWSRP